MDLSQEKPTRSEWQNLEIPVSEEEQVILKMLMAGYSNPDIYANKHSSIAAFMKIVTHDKDESMDAYIYTQFFQDSIQAIVNMMPSSLSAPVLPPAKKIKLKKTDMIRIEQMKKNIVSAGNIYEYFLIKTLHAAVHSYAVAKTRDYIQHIYTLIQLQVSATIHHLNAFVQDFIHRSVALLKPHITVCDVVLDACKTVEQNSALIQYADLTLYSHQKDLFRIFRQERRDIPRLVLYTAPTGTGKTMSPLALAQNDYCVLFMCSARHVGLGLAKAAISMGKRVAFAYGCHSAEDIRLHNFAAVDYTVHKKSGTIWKVDNTNGIRVEIMICDIKSYVIAMNYMLEFHPLESLILYWDEPTITMDYESHPLHPLIHRNWKENRLTNVVLSCATLPKSDEISQTLDNFRAHFENAEIHSIVSYECRKSISIMDTDNKVVLPHLLFAKDASLLQKSVEYCQKNKTMLRYFDLKEIVRFLDLASLSLQEWMEYFSQDISLVNMKSIKLSYLKILAESVDLSDSKWSGLLIYLKETQTVRGAATGGGGSAISKSHSLTAVATTVIATGQGQPIKRMQSVVELGTATPIPQNIFTGILFTTEDAHTLTDGPTIYLAENVEKLGMFYLKQTQFPPNELSQLLSKIHKNNEIEQMIQNLENQMEDHLGKENAKEKKMIKEHFSKEVKILKTQIEAKRSQLESLSIRQVLVPNSEDHLIKWFKSSPLPSLPSLPSLSSLSPQGFGKPFTSHIGEAQILRIMKSDIQDMQKILLLLGIGIFSKEIDATYLEIIKELANEQKLFLIIASSDYIYGTNYQFCHGILGKDLTDMTQQKMIQALGRVGRNNIQQDYTVRFRHNDLLKTLFLPMETNREAVNMSRLFMK